MSDGPPMPQGAPRDLEQVYEDYTPLLLSAVASLARKGYDIHPAEGLEVVHDFYLEALPGLLQRYDPARAKFSTYLYGAFLHFARPRIVRNIRWAHMLVPFDDAIEHQTAVEDADDLSGLRECLAVSFQALPKDLRATLEARISKAESEREVARRFKVSRYVVRQRLAEALGRLAIALEHDEAIPRHLRPLAVRLWRDGQPLMSVAAERGLTRQQARQQLGELIRSLTDVAANLGPE
jgi:RNA polymerase sigma factor (sigma-70 family)